MAYQRGRAGKEEHAFKRIARDVKAGDVPPVVVLCGKEQYLTSWGTELITDRFVNPATKALDFTHFSDDTVSVDGIIEACETLSMFSERRVTAVSGFAPLEGAKLKGFSEDDEARLVEYIKNIPDGAVLIFTCGVPDKRRKLFKACSEAGRIYEFDTLSESDLTNFIIKRIKLAGKTCKTTVINELISNSGYYNKETDYTLYNLENDLKKIMAYSEGEEITVQDVLSVISGSLETYIFALIDSISAGKKGEAYKLLYNILQSGESIYRVLSMIVSQYEFILEVKELREAGLGKDEIVKTLAAHEFRVRKALGFADKYSVPALRSILIAAYNTDKNIKSGLITQDLALEMLIASI